MKLDDPQFMSTKDAFEEILSFVESEIKDMKKWDRHFIPEKHSKLKLAYETLTDFAMNNIFR